ncbi:Wdr18 [Scenedesmus sp. PABB004]|nr:Wdr18 [Scenedesmus sp. PABB004]
MAAQSGKDAIHVWAWHKDQVLQRCFTQEPVTALAGSPDGGYVAAGGASGALYVWEAATGRLLRSWPAHYKAVSALRFDDAGGVLVSGGDDTLVCAWLLAELLDELRGAPGAAAAAAAGAARVAPLHTWSEHTLPVTALHVGAGEGSALLATASLDRTVKLWALATGQLLRSVALPAAVTAVALDAGEHVLLAGCADGSIWEASLTGQPPAGGAAPAAAAAGSSGRGPAGVLGGPGSCCYEGHTKAISSLAITPDGEQLVSGSEDGSARVWDLRSRQCLRTIPSPARLPGPKRMTPLAPFAKFVGAAGAAVKPWEGPPVVLTGALLGSGAAGISAEAGLLPDAASPLDALRQAAAGGGGGGGGDALAAPLQLEGTGAGDEADAAQLQRTVEQLRQQLHEARQVAQQWQALHGELHQYAAEQVLRAP